MSSTSRRRAASPPRGGVGKLRMDRQPTVTRISGKTHVYHCFGNQEI